MVCNIWLDTASVRTVCRGSEPLAGPLQALWGDSPYFAGICLIFPLHCELGIVYQGGIYWRPTQTLGNYVFIADSTLSAPSCSKGRCLVWLAWWVFLDLVSGCRYCWHHSSTCLGLQNLQPGWLVPPGGSNSGCYSLCLVWCSESHLCIRFSFVLYLCIPSSFLALEDFISSWVL